MEGEVKALDGQVKAVRRQWTDPIECVQAFEQCSRHDLLRGRCATKEMIDPQSTRCHLCGFGQPLRTAMFAAMWHWKAVKHTRNGSESVDENRSLTAASAARPLARSSSPPESEPGGSVRCY